MSHDMMFAGDPATFANLSDSFQELECECGWIGEVPTTEEYSHKTVSWYAEWKCPNCDESNTNEGWYDPSVVD